MRSELFKKAKAVIESNTDQNNVYATQCFKLAEDGLLSGEHENILCRHSVAYPEPPLKTNPLKLPPREKADAASNKFRDASLRQYEEIRLKRETNSYKQ